MKTFKYTIRDTEAGDSRIVKDFTVEAENEEEAEKYAQEQVQFFIENLLLEEE